MRLARVLAERKVKEGGYSALAEAIDRSSAADTKADPDQGDRKRKFDRRKIKSIIEADPKLVLSLRELRALDSYLERFGEGLAYAPLFQKPDLIQTLADSGRVTFLLGSKPEKEFQYFSHWDVLAMAEIQRGINASEVGVRFDIQEVMLHEKLQRTVASLKNGGWTGLMEDHGPSLVCLGSSRTSPAAEVMLSRMFQRPHYRKAPPAENWRLPFHFVWSTGVDYVFPSHFHLDSEEIADRDPDAADLIGKGDASAVVTAQDVFVDGVLRTHQGDTYGVCVAQRRKRGQVWLVLAGVTGAATYVTAKLAKNLAIRFHEQKRGQDSNIYWAVIRAHVTADSKRPLASVRTFAEESIASGLHVWKTEAG